MTNTDPQKIGAVLSDLIRKFGYEDKLREVDAVKLFNEVAGEKIAEHCQAIKITDGRLILRVSDPIWRQQLVFLKGDLIAKLNARLGKSVVKDIYLK